MYFFCFDGNILSKFSEHRHQRSGSVVYVNKTNNERVKKIADVQLLLRVEKNEHHQNVTSHFYEESIQIIFDRRVHKLCNHRRVAKMVANLLTLIVQGIGGSCDKR